MEQFLQWVKGIVLVFFVLMMVTYLIPKKEYKKYICFFVNIVMALAVLSPVMNFFHGTEEWSRKIQMEELKLQLKNIEADEEKLSELGNQYYKTVYETEVTKFVKELLAEYAIVEKVQLVLSEEGEAEEICVWVSEYADAPSTGESNFFAAGKEQEMKEKLSSFYGMDENMITIRKEGL